MNRTEISQQLAEIKIEVITSKNKFKKMALSPQWREVIAKEKDNSEDLVQTFSIIINQLNILEKEISGHHFLKK